MNQWKRSIFCILFNNLNSVINVTVLYIINLMFLLIIYDSHEMNIVSSDVTDVW